MENRKEFMERYLENVALKDYFLDFGGADAVGDSVFVPPTDNKQIEKVLHSVEFAELYREYLHFLLPNGLEVHEEEIYGITVHVLEDVAHFYSLAGQFAYGKITGKEGIYLGTYDNSLAIAAAKLANYAEMDIKIVLGREASKDEKSVSELKSMGADVDTESCRIYFDIPYAYSTLSFGPASPLQVVSLDANNGAAPIPSITGEIVGLLSADLKKKFADVSCWIANIKTGTEAIAMFKDVLDEGKKLITVEEPKSRELHLIDTACYTISARYADKEEQDVTLCPELVSWWRQAKVERLGSDTLREPDLSEIRNSLKESSKRAVALLHKIHPEVKEVLLMEDK